MVVSMSVVLGSSLSMWAGGRGLSRRNSTIYPYLHKGMSVPGSEARIVHHHCPGCSQHAHIMSGSTPHLRLVSLSSHPNHGQQSFRPWRSPWWPSCPSSKAWLLPDLHHRRTARSSSTSERIFGDCIITTVSESRKTCACCVRPKACRAADTGLELPAHLKQNCDNVLRNNSLVAARPKSA